MKTTNNKLLDNTGNPVSHNRPQQYQGVPLEQYLEIVAMKDKLEKENQELKEHNINQRKAFAILLNEEEDKYKKEFRELNDKLLKVVDNVLTKEHYAMSLVFVPICYSYNDPRKPKTQLTTSYVLDKWEVLQEIKSAIEKGKE